MAHIPRIHWPHALQVSDHITLDGDRAHHLLKVLKRKSGDALILFQDTYEFDCQITATQKNQLSLLIEAKREVGRESPLQTVLIQCLSRGDKMDFTIQKAVELGVSRIQPVTSERGGVQLDAKRMAKKQAHWQAVALSAAEQSGRTVIPQVSGCQKLDAHLQQHAPLQGFTLAPNRPSLAAHKPDIRQPLHLLIGPEGGLSDHEISLAERAGLKAAGLGPRILRTETAGLVALSTLQWLWGRRFPGKTKYCSQRV